MKYTSLILMTAAAGLLGGCESFSSTSVAIEHYVTGRMAMDRDGYEIALAELTRAVKADPNLSLAHAAIGDIHRKQGDYTAAATAYEKSCNINPYAFRSHYNLGVTYKYLSEAARSAKAAADFLRKAVHVYLRAVMLKPGDFDANLNLSACYFEMGKYDLAEQYCSRAIKLDAKKPYAWSNLAIIYDSQNRPYDAIRAYKASLELDVHQSKLLLNLGSTYLRLGRLKEAIGAFGLASREDANCSDAWEQIGVCYFLQKKLGDALSAYEKAIRLNGRSAPAYRGLGVVYMSRFIQSNGDAGLRDKALNAWNRSLELNSNQPDLLRLVQKYTPKHTTSKL